MKAVLVALLCLSTLLVACGAEPSGGAAATAAPPASSAVSTHGRLRVCGVKICDQAGAQVQLRGMSLYWSNTGWGGERFYNATAVSNLASTWGATVVRAAVGVEGDGGYLESAASAQANLDRAITVIDAAIASGIYVIVDWHSVSSVSHQSQAQAFFQQLATRYASAPNLIWEPFNEPTTVPWGSLKTYHQAIINTIRNAGSQNLVVAGTPTWSQDVDVAAADRLSDGNTAYTLHFYAGTHGQSLRDKAMLAMSRGAALFVTEWGTCDASGNGNYDPTESTAWANWMDANGISSANWALDDKLETASALVSGGAASSTGPWPDSQLTQSGLFVKSYVGRIPVGGPTYALTVTNVSQNGGAGTVTNPKNQIYCGSSCYYRYPTDWVTTLTATAASPGSTFLGWGGACSGTAPTCTVTLTQDQTVTATFGPSGDPSLYTLTVGNGGPGSGKVTSTPAGIDCGTTCSAGFPAGTVVTLTAAAISGTGTMFTSWSGACTGSARTCVVTMTSALSASATFAGSVARYPVLVSKNGSGTGTVTSSVGEIVCGTACSQRLAVNTTVTLTAAADPGSAFTGWSGSCAGSTSTCVLTITSAGADVTARFDTTGPAYKLTVTSNGGSAGGVSSLPVGIQCGATCSTSFAAGQVVTLTATAVTGASLTSWGGACSGSAPTCVVTMNQDTSVTATFSVGTAYQLGVTMAGTGSGRVTPSGTGYCSMGGTCFYYFGAGTTVTLTAAPDSGSLFAGWSGACTGTAPTCVVTMSQDRAVTATFSPIARYTLAVTKAGTGSGFVDSVPGGISCGDTCAATYNSGTTVTLTAIAIVGSAFAGWEGGCSGTTAVCAVSMNQAQAVTATFSPNPTTFPLTVTKAGTGAGTVTSTPAGIACGATCAASYSGGTVVSLVASPSSGSTFAGWGGACSGTFSTTCALSMSQARAVTATFDAPATGGCKVTYTVTGQWSGGFGGSLVIQNTGPTAWTSWTVTWTYPNASQKITQIWNATVSQSGQAVTLRNLSYNGSIPAGGSYSGVGFNGTWSGSNPAPAAFAVNGIPCN